MALLPQSAMSHQRRRPLRVWSRRSHPQAGQCFSRLRSLRRRRPIRGRSRRVLLGIHQRGSVHPLHPPRPRHRPSRREHQLHRSARRIHAHRRRRHHAPGDPRRRPCSGRRSRRGRRNWGRCQLISHSLRVRPDGNGATRPSHLFFALLPATAVIIALAQIPQPIEILAVGLVVTGVLTHREPSNQTRAGRAGGRSQPGAGALR